MSHREEMADYREWKRLHPKGWTRWPRVRQDNRAVAVTYCQQGFAIVPLIPSTKFPALPSPHPHGSPERGTCKGECALLGHGFHDATSDAAWANEYWRVNPDHGIGVRPAPGMIVLDVDARHGGVEALAALVAEHGPLPETATISGRGDGGHHLWFDGVGGPVRSKLCAGVDILCHARNFVTVPPSPHHVTDQPYTFKQPCADIAAAPAWLVRECAKPDPPPRPRRAAWPRTWRLSPSQRLHHCRGLIDTVTASAEGDRHTTLLWAGCRAAESGFMAEEDDPVWTALAEAADAAGLDHDEIRRVLHGAIAIAGRED